MTRFLVLALGVSLLTALIAGCGSNEAGKGKNSGLDRPKSAGKE